MAASYVIQVFVDGRFSRLVSEERLGRVARRVLVAEEAAACELSVAVTDDETVRRLNREYAGEDYVTDVLSFSHLEGEELVGPPGEMPSLGEVVIAYPQAERQARERGHETHTEIERLLVHGVLHLLGYDHAGREEEREMRAREAALAEELPTE